MRIRYVADCYSLEIVRCAGLLRSRHFFFLGGVARGVVLIAVALSHRMLMNYFRSSCSMLLKMKCFRVDT